MNALAPLTEIPRQLFRSSDPIGTVRWLLGGSYPAYARAFHPVPAGEGRYTTWGQTARATGKTVHSEMQYDRISVGLPDDSDRPARASMGAVAWRSLIQNVGPFGDPDCIAALWTGRDWLSAGRDCDREDRCVVEKKSWAEAQTLSRPPGRSYRVFTTSLRDIASFGVALSPDFFVFAQPTLVWDRALSWCIATDPDYDSSVIGGDPPLIERICGDPQIEALPIGGEQSLLLAADSINV